MMDVRRVKEQGMVRNKRMMKLGRSGRTLCLPESCY